MGRKLTKRVSLLVGVEEAQHQELRTLAFETHQSLADVVRQALTEFLEREKQEGRLTVKPPRGDSAELEKAPESKGRQRQVPL